jgi:hypothetical protein
MFLILHDNSRIEVNHTYFLNVCGQIQAIRTAINAESEYRLPEYMTIRDAELLVEYINICGTTNKFVPIFPMQLSNYIQDIDIIKSPESTQKQLEDSPFNIPIEFIEFGMKICGGPDDVTAPIVNLTNAAFDLSISGLYPLCILFLILFSRFSNEIDLFSEVEESEETAEAEFHDELVIELVDRIISSHDVSDDTSSSTDKTSDPKWTIYFTNYVSVESG